MPVSCDAQDLVNGAACFYCKSPNLDNVEIYLLCVVANGGVVPPPPGGVILGNPDEDWGFGDPGGDFVFGVPD
jgi:hypothetical protein